MTLAVEVCSAQHIGDREEQQDRVVILPHPQYPGSLMAVVADGMGGLTGGAIAAEQVIHCARASYERFGPGGDPRELLASAINDAHQGIRLTALTSDQEPHSTACVLVMQPGRVDWAHCGDSRIYHFRHGELIARSVDHSVVMRKMVLPGYLTEAQAEKHPNKNLLLSCLGDEAMPEIEFGEAAPVVSGDSFLLCSDGVWAHFSNDEMGQLLHTLAPRQAAEALIEGARTRAAGRGDNCALAIVRIRQREAAEPKMAVRLGRQRAAVI